MCERAQTSEAQRRLLPQLRPLASSLPCESAQPAPSGLTLPLRIQGEATGQRRAGGWPSGNSVGRGGAGGRRPSPAWPAPGRVRASNSGAWVDGEKAGASEQLGGGGQGVDSGPGKSSRPRGRREGALSTKASQARQEGKTK